MSKVHRLNEKDVEDIFRQVDRDLGRTANAVSSRAAPYEAPHAAPHAALGHRGLKPHLVGFHRITVREACALMADSHLDVWTGHKGVYTKVDKELIAMAIKRSEIIKDSFCSSFLKGTLGFTPERYAVEKEKLGEIDPGSPVGIYQSNVGNRMVIVVDRDRIKRMF